MSSYKTDLTKNTIWNAIENYSMIGIQLLCTFIVARFLSPKDFGIVGMLVVFTVISQTIIDSGFGQALIREKDVKEEDYSSVFWVNLLISLALYFVLFLSSNLIAEFYHEPILEKTCKVTFLVLPLNALNLVQIAKFRKELQFKKMCIASISASVLSSVIAIFLAWYYKNVWALVIQNVLMYAFRAVIIWIVSKWIPSFVFSVGTIKRYFKFSKNILIAGLVGNVFNNIYSLLIGRFYTSTDLGFYTQADRIKNVSSHTSTSVIQNVTYPILSKINNEGGDLKAAYIKIISVTLLFVGTVVSLLMCISVDLFEILMGDHVWRISGEYFMILGIGGILYPLHAVNQNILLVKGRSQVLMRLELLRRFLFTIIIAVTVQFSLIVFISGYAIYSLVLLFINLYYCGKPIDYSLYDQLKDVTPILSVFLCVIICSFLTNHLLSDYNIYFRMMLTEFACASVGLAIMWRMGAFRELLTLLRFKQSKSQDFV